MNYIEDTTLEDIYLWRRKKLAFLVVLDAVLFVVAAACSIREGHIQQGRDELPTFLSLLAFGETSFFASFAALVAALAAALCFTGVFFAVVEVFLVAAVAAVFFAMGLASFFVAAA